MKAHGYTVGVFDSGVGGLSVLRALLQAVPEAHFVYLADSGHAPYGERPPEWVAARAHRIVNEMRSRYALDALVVACNTATALAIDSLRAHHHDIPFVGVEPALKPAAALSRTRQIGVMATRGTLSSDRYQGLKGRLLHGSHPPTFHDLACDGLADAIERGDELQTGVLCKRYVDELMGRSSSDLPIDTLVLGCTHYPFAAAKLQAFCSGVELVETGAPVARRTREVLRATRLVTQSTTHPLRLFSSGTTDHLKQLVKRWLALDVPVEAWGD